MSYSEEGESICNPLIAKHAPEWLYAAGQMAVGDWLVRGLPPCMTIVRAGCGPGGRSWPLAGDCDWATVSWPPGAASSPLFTVALAGNPPLCPSAPGWLPEDCCGCGTGPPLACESPAAPPPIWEWAVAPGLPARVHLDGSTGAERRHPRLLRELCNGLDRPWPL